MSEQILSAIIGGISGAIFSGIIYWLLDKHKENKLNRKYKQQHKDAVDFLDHLHTFQKSTNSMENYFDNLGTYRANKISPILEKAKILKVNLLGTGGFSLTIRSCFHTYNKKQINDIKSDIKNGLYDEYLN